MKRDGTVVRYQRFATLNDIALSNQVVQNLGLWETLAYQGDTVDTVHHMLGEGTEGWRGSAPSHKRVEIGVSCLCVWRGTWGSYILRLEQQLYRAV